MPQGTPCQTEGQTLSYLFPLCVGSEFHSTSTWDISLQPPKTLPKSSRKQTQDFTFLSEAEGRDQPAGSVTVTSPPSPSLPAVLLRQISVVQGACTPRPLRSSPGSCLFPHPTAGESQNRVLPRQRPGLGRCCSEHSGHGAPGTRPGAAPDGGGAPAAPAPLPAPSPSTPGPFRSALPQRRPLPRQRSVCASRRRPAALRRAGAPPLAARRGGLCPPAAGAQAGSPGCPRSGHGAGEPRPSPPLPPGGAGSTPAPLPARAAPAPLAPARRDPAPRAAPAAVPAPLGPARPSPPLIGPPPHEYANRDPRPSNGRRAGN